MDTINLPGARARLSNLVGWVEAGDTVCIAQRDRPVRLTAGATQRKRIDRATLERRWRPIPRPSWHDPAPTSRTITVPFEESSN